jgi:hypothetical protein
MGGENWRTRSRSWSNRDFGRDTSIDIRVGVGADRLRVLARIDEMEDITPLVANVFTSPGR